MQVVAARSGSASVLNVLPRGDLFRASAAMRRTNRAPDLIFGKEHIIERDIGGLAMEVVDRLMKLISSPTKRMLPAIGLCLLTAHHFPAQERPEGRRQFGVASIKPNHSGVQKMQKYEYGRGGRFTATNATLVDMIVSVYPTRRIQMHGGPDWIDSVRFDVIAKADPDEGQVKPEQWPQMVQVLLEDRFNLRFHTETREAQVLALVMGKTTPKLEKPKADEKTELILERGQFIFRNMPFVALVNTMSNILHTPVVDRTGITDYLDFTVDPTQVAVQDGPDGPASKQSLGDRFVVAVREQLGFRVEKQRAQLVFTIIDHAEKPTEN